MLNKKFQRWIVQIVQPLLELFLLAAVDAPLSQQNYLIGVKG